MGTLHTKSYKNYWDEFKKFLHDSFITTIFTILVFLATQKRSKEIESCKARQHSNSIGLNLVLPVLVIKKFSTINTNNALNAVNKMHFHFENKFNQKI